MCKRYDGKRTGSYMDFADPADCFQCLFPVYRNDRYGSKGCVVWWRRHGNEDFSFRANTAAAGNFMYRSRNECVGFDHAAALSK